MPTQARDPFQEISHNAATSVAARALQLRRAPLEIIQIKKAKKEAVVAKRMFSLIVGAIALVALAPFSVTTSAQEMTCRVPFGFIVNGRTLPAGQYSVANNNGMLIVRGERDGAMVLGIPAGRQNEQSTRASLVFLKTGTRYDLSEIWSPDGDRRILRPSRRQLEERARATGDTPVERIVIPFN